MEVFFDVEDITDPSLMGNILIRLDEIQSEDEEFMQTLLTKQNEMVITWTQPWYQQSNCITRPFNQSKSKEVDMFRTDPITFEESNKIRENWRIFRKMFRVPNKPICLARWKNKEKCRSPTTPEEFVRRFVISFLAQDLERNLYQVYKHFVIHYGSPNKGHYSQYEENIMAVCIYNSPKNTVPYLSALLSREPRGIYKRLKQMYNGKPDKKRLKWTLPLATRFLNLLLEYTGESLENLKQRKIEKSIWLKLEKDIDQYYIYLQKFWYDSLHIQLFVRSDVKLNKLRRKIFKKLTLYPYRVWTDINWKEIAKHFSDGFNHRFLYTICRNVIYKTLPGYLNHPLEDVIEHGLQKSKFGRNRRLKTLHLNENGELKIIRYNDKIKF